jgi:hypothetical protein
LAAGSAAAVTAALQAVVFTPAAGAPGATSSTSFLLNDVSSAGTAASDGGATVLDIDPAAPVPAATPQAAAPTVTFNSGVAFSGRRNATLSGTVSDPSGVASLEVFNGGQSLGAATVNGDGTWTFAATLPRGDYNAISVTATDGQGDASSTPAPFELQTGIAGQPYTTDETDFDSLGQTTGDSYTKANGVVYLQDTVAHKPGGGATVDYTNGTYFNALDYYFQTIDLSPDNAVLQQTFYNDDGTHSVVGSANHMHLDALGSDTMTGGGARETFVFKPHPGQETITDFIATGPGHDTISLPPGEFASIAQILHGLTQQSDGATLIALGPHSSITLDNVAADTLTRSDFLLRA